MSGRVVEKATGDGIYDLTVQVVGRELSTTTNEKGEFTLSLPAGSYSLEFVSEFYDKQRISITVPSGGDLVLTAPVALKLSGTQAEVTAETVVKTWDPWAQARSIPCWQRMLYLAAAPAWSIHGSLS